MANPEHLAILKQGAEVWNRWRVQNRQTRPDLARAALCGARLSQADFAHAILNDANLSQADLSRAGFYAADLARTKLSGAILHGACFLTSNLFRTDFTEADLRGADFRGANLTASVVREANFERATFLHTTLARLDLSGAFGLETVKHLGPSTIGLDTFFCSEARIPGSFLRGCGLPDSFIQYAASLAAKPIDFNSCFISYSTKDQEFAERLHGDLQAKGVRCWFAPEDLKIGDKFRVTIDETIRIYDKLLLVLSEQSLHSGWVEKEVETAMEKEREQSRTMLFPIRLDDAVMEIKTGWPADIRRTRHIGDFRNWKDPDAYQQAFERLLRDLKASERKGS